MSLLLYAFIYDTIRYVAFAINYSESVVSESVVAHGLCSLLIRSYTLMNGKRKQYTELRHNGNNRNISIAIIRARERNLLEIDNKKKKRSEK